MILADDIIDLVKNEYKPNTMFKKYLTRDNFWNLMFWVLMVIGFSFTFAFSNATGVAIFFVTLFVVPRLIKKAQKLSFDKEGHFLNSNGKSLKMRYPRCTGVAFVLSIIGFFGFCFFLDILGVGKDFPGGVILSLPILLFVSYFIFINCPISILFYKKAWSKDIAVTGWHHDPNLKIERSNSRSKSVSEYFTNSQYRSMRCNSYNRRHR